MRRKDQTAVPGRCGGHVRAAADALAQTFEEAVARDADAAPSQWFRFGGHVVCVRVAGAALRETITRAFAHLRIAAAGNAACEISMWDAAATGVACPVEDLASVLEETWPLGESLFATSADKAAVGSQSPAMTAIYERARGRIIGAVAADERLSLFERGKPLQSMLFAWYSDMGISPVHAGLVARDGRGVLLGGAGGAGKTTTSLVCMSAGFDYLGDDYIGLPAMGECAPHGFSLYTTAWLESEHSRRFPRLLAHTRAGVPGKDKLLVYLSEASGVRFRECAEIVAVALPRVAHQPHTLHRAATKAESMLRLAPSSLLQLPFIQPKPALDRMAALAAGVPTYWLDLGTKLDEIPAAVDAVIADALSRMPAHRPLQRSEGRWP